MGDDVRDGSGASAKRPGGVLVLGPARSGADTLARALHLLGLRAPEPALASGGTDSNWISDFHADLLHRANVRVTDARPQAWFETGRLATQDGPRQELFTWLQDRAADGTGDLVVRDPRLAWFAGLWKAAGLRCGIDLSYAVVLRPAVETVLLKPRSGTAYPDTTSRAAGWLNQALHTERATRGSRRAFLTHQELVDDWTVPIYALGERFGLASIHEATAKEIRRVHDLIEPAPAASSAGWADADVPKPLRIMIDEAWDQFLKLGRSDDEPTEPQATLDQIREEYTQYYAEAEQIAHSTILAARRRKPTPEEAAPVGEAALDDTASTAATRRRRLGRRPRG